MHVLCEVEGVSYAVLVAGLPLDRTKIVPPKNTDVFVLLTRRWGKVANRRGVFATVTRFLGFYLWDKSANN